MKEYDHIIVGTGQATGTLLGKLISTGKKIAVIEGHKVGGSCVNYGCTPTKTMVASAKALYQAKRGDFFGFSTGEVSINFSRIRERMNEVRNSSSDGLSGWMESTPNVDLIRGWASFDGPKTLKVNDDILKGENIYINVGTRPSAPPITGLDDVPWMDSERLLELTELPEHLIIIGGGYIGIEFAQVFKRLGSKVTVVQRGGQIMPQEDEDVALAIQEFIESEGITIRLNASAKEVSNSNGVELKVESGGKEETIQGSHLLIAAGRKTNSDTLNLEATGVEVGERGFIPVDDYCQTNVDGIYAVGDVNGHGAFTHTAVNDAEIVIDHMYGGKRKLSNRIPIYGLFTDPPLGRVGMSEKEALAKGYEILKATKPMAQISRAKEMGETNGFAKLIVDAKTDLILGASILGPGGDEIINMFAAIMHSKIPCKNYREVMLVHPTVSELMPWVLDGLQKVN